MTAPSDDLLPPTGGPRLTAPPSLRRRLEQSPLVFVGDVVSVEGDRAELRITELLRGQNAVGETVVVSGATSPYVGVVRVGSSAVWLVSAMGEPPGLLAGGASGPPLAEIQSMLADSRYRPL